MYIYIYGMYIYRIYIILFLILLVSSSEMSHGPSVGFVSYELTSFSSRFGLRVEKSLMRLRSTGQS